ncbi:helix-turn-helix transcriptional regulator [Massilia sp. S19_KUP03_FR1]|uniref:helix-turn-helix transcriptional regulator n=1 Tax=Massilia sp. S19_KUP03_FR1 TaxID=3025503 RepID=UPI002FCDA00F
MSRSERLLHLLQVLRRHRQPVSGQALARETGVSIRTLYRDIASLQAQGADIAGEAGVGYVMQPGFMLPPLMFGADELDALVLGMRLVADLGDPALAQGAANALAKLAAVLPPELRREAQTSALLPGFGRPAVAQGVVAAAPLRAAIRAERKLSIRYRDPSGTVSERVVWPYALVYFDLTRVLMCWCELRGAFRNFRVDRIAAADTLAERYPRHRQALLKEWRKQEFVPERSMLP